MKITGLKTNIFSSQHRNAKRNWLIVRLTTDEGIEGIGEASMLGYDPLVARLLLLQCGDEVWKDYLAGLRSLTIVSRLGDYGHKSAVADYIIHAAGDWKRFQGEAVDLFLSRLLTFPLSRLTELPAQPEKVVELNKDVAMLVG